jgi:threonine dehydratase
MNQIFRLPSIEDVRDAAAGIQPYAVRTPLMESAFLNDRIGTRVLLKAEVLQRTGSFKFRGAYNCVSRIDRKAYPGGVVACSSGNHAQGVAEAARLCEIPSTIVMPSDAPAIKVERTRRSGADIIHYDRYAEDRDAIAAALSKQKNAQFVAPFDNPHVIAGQGTVGLEIAEQAKLLGLELEAVLAPCSGGGLASGISLSMEDAMPSCKIYTVEPDGFDDYARSLKSGHREQNAPDARSICDALLTKKPGELTFAIGEKRFGQGIVVPDDETRAAVAFAFNELKLVVEPGGAIGLAALLAGHYRGSSQAIAVVLSGGNISAAMLSECLAAKQG